MRVHVHALGKRSERLARGTPIVVIRSHGSNLPLGAHLGLETEPPRLAPARGSIARDCGRGHVVARAIAAPLRSLPLLVPSLPAGRQRAHPRSSLRTTSLDLWGRSSPNRGRSLRRSLRSRSLGPFRARSRPTSNRARNYSRAGFAHTCRFPECPRSIESIRVASSVTWRKWGFVQPLARPHSSVGLCACGRKCSLTAARDHGFPS